MSVKDLEEGLLDFASLASSELQETLSLASNNDQKDSIILEHIKKLSSSDRPSVLNPDEKAEWATGLKDQTLYTYCNGHLALIDFFTYCCINCQHVLPDLKDLESIYSPDDGLVVVGVHSAKFDAERDSENVRRAATRLNVDHPVLNDPKAVVWSRLGIHCWPTLLLLDPEGRPILVLAGEGHRDLLFRVVAVAIVHFREKNMLKKSKVSTLDPRVYGDPSNLKFPGKVCLNNFNKGISGEPYLTISDSGNNRILVIDSSRKVLYIVGGQDVGFKDGSFNDAKFDSPQGVCWLDAETFVVCDTGNHAIRKVTLGNKKVELFAGTGVQAEFSDQGGLKYCQQSISSPWDIILYETPDMDMSLRSPLLKKDEKCDTEKEVKEKEDSSPVDDLRKVLLIASAGCHQIWALFLDTTVWWKYRTYAEGTLIPIVGSGREENRNNRYPSAAGLAQPSGLSLSGHFLYIADSESSTIRKLDLTSGHLHPCVGGDRNPCNLFAYGDIDGIGYSARLQHPLGVECCPKSAIVYVADTYNHKIKAIDTTNSECVAFYPAYNSKVHLSEPGGICIIPNGKTMFVADSNNHRIISIDIESKKSEHVKLTFSLDTKRDELSEDYKKKDIIYCRTLVSVCSKKGSKLTVTINCDTEKGGKDLHLTPQAPQRWSVKFFIAKMKTCDLISEWDIVGSIRSGKELPATFEAFVKSDLNDTERVMRIEFFISLCEGGLCFVRRFAIDCVVGLKPTYKSAAKYNLKCTINPAKELSVQTVECT